MRTYPRLVAVAILLAMGVSVGFGWGTVTHVYFANHLGVRLGNLNQNEMYGATLTDVFGYDFTERGFIADYALHTSKDLLWGFYLNSPGQQSKAGFYGMFSHNNINDPAFADMRGADWTAHGIYPEPMGMPDPNGWVVNQGLILAGNPEISGYVVGLIGPDAAPYFLPIVGHILIESGFDILVRRNEDPLVGARLYVAANNRSGDIPLVFAGVLESQGLYTAADAVAAEAGWKQQMIGYGQLFMLPEGQLIRTMSQQTAVLGQTFIAQVLGIPDVQIDPARIEQFIRIAIRQIRNSYRVELKTTLAMLESNMLNGPPPAGPIWAFWKEGSEDEAIAALAGVRETPTEYALDQNFPNPFNPSTTINYAVPANCRVSLKVYNLLGQVVATLVDQEMSAGRYSFVWDATGFASGAYFYKLEAGSTNLVKRMILTK